MQDEHMEDGLLEVPGPRPVSWLGPLDGVSSMTTPWASERGRIWGKQLHLQSPLMFLPISPAQSHSMNKEERGPASWKLTCLAQDPSLGSLPWNFLLLLIIPVVWWVWALWGRLYCLRWLPSGGLMDPVFRKIFFNYWVFAIIILKSVTQEISYFTLEWMSSQVYILTNMKMPSPNLWSYAVGPSHPKILRLWMQPIVDQKYSGGKNIPENSEKLKTWICCNYFHSILHCISTLPLDLHCVRFYK